MQEERILLYLNIINIFKLYLYTPPLLFRSFDINVHNKSITHLSTLDLVTITIKIIKDFY